MRIDVSRSLSCTIEITDFEPSVTKMRNRMFTLVGEELDANGFKWCTSLAAPNASIYGIPYCAGRSVKFDPVDKSMTEIGPDFGYGSRKWKGGAITGNGIIYCPPCKGLDHGILKIDTNTDNVTILDFNRFPEQGCEPMWNSCALALDGCIYFMPCKANHIMKLDPNNNDAMTSVGDDLSDHNVRFKYSGTIVGIDGCVYGIPNYSKRIVKYDPINGTTSFLGEVTFYFCCGNGCLGSDGCIYTLLSNGTVLKINTTTQSFHSFGIEINKTSFNGFGNAILGIDGCIYWPPCNTTKILKCDPHLNLTQLVGHDFGTRDDHKWVGGCATSDGIIYCLPSSTNKILAIDPLKEYTLSLKNNMEEHPEEFGCIFQPSDDIPDETHFDRAVTKFGQRKVLDLLEKSMRPVHQFCSTTNLSPFMIAASCKGSHISVIYYLIRNLSLSVFRTLDSSSIYGLEGKSVGIKKRKCNFY